MIHITQDGAVCVLRKRNVGGQPDMWWEETEGERGERKTDVLVDMHVLRSCRRKPVFRGGSNFI